MASKYQQQLMKLPIHFFKVILTRTLEEGKLMIPSKFVREYGECLPNTVFLKLPSGAEWKINVAKHGDQAWFEKGWKEFAKCNSLAHGHFLVFRFGETSCLEVHIFDKCGLEIDYPSNREEGNRLAEPQGFQAPEINILKECPPCRKREDNSQPAFPQPSKKTRANDDGEVESMSNLQKETLHHTSKECKEHSHGVSTSKFQKQKAVRGLQQAMITKCENGRALEKANAFMPQKPSFHVVMQPSYIHSHVALNIPAKFVRTYLDLEKRRGILTLKLDGRVWPVNFLIRNVSTRKRFELSTGWKAFAKANNLNLGDVCVFELIHRTEIAFRVSIFRDSDCPNRCFSQGNLKQLNKEKITADLKPKRPSVSDSGVYEASGKSNLNYPSIRVIIKASHIQRSSMTLPQSFDRGFVKSGGQMVTMQVGEKSWRIRLIHYPKIPASYFSAGWSAFVRENALEAGDVCLFNWVSTDVIQVSIFRHLEV
ncbi:hypothetical protein L6164_001060 [Bauhinia variegata]|uniref:Uncharacterized protein n=1 Tax=Bauhinia variegata TaxID=167791 RepID=A0ACB9Q7Q7_BAUVA|nr:hypothetical protein L6164_001060 [Bauhinia variegata]